MTKQMIGAAITLATLLPAAGCIEPEVDETLGTEQSDVIAGDSFSAEGSGYVKLNTSAGGCSGTLMTNNLVLTARHCFGATDVATPSVVAATMGSQFSKGSLVTLDPNDDVALLRLATPFAMNGSTTNYQALLYPGPANTVQPGEILTCRGYGINDWNANSGFGMLRTADLPVRGVNFTWWFEHYDTAVNPNARGQFLGFGDSGGSCFKIMPTGEQVLVGVTSTVYHEFDGTFNGLVSADTLRSWYSSVVTPSTDIVQQWGQAGDVPVPADFDGDGKADFVVWRPSDGVWWVMNSVTRGVVTQQWGQAGDVPVRGDFDHDGRADYAIWRPSTGVWWVIDSSTGGVTSQQWGMAGDIPVPGDYDGDGKTDYAIWRPSTGTWWVINSSTGAMTSQQWGQLGDVPVAGDYNADGRTDDAVWRPSTGTWFVINSFTGQPVSKQFGANGDVPTTAHLGCANKLTIWRPWSGGFWIAGGTNTPLGQPGDIPVMANYAGLSSPDAAVWRPSNGTWYVSVNPSGC